MDLHTEEKTGDRVGPKKMIVVAVGTRTTMKGWMTTTGRTTTARTTMERTMTAKDEECSIDVNSGNPVDLLDRIFADSRFDYQSPMDRPYFSAKIFISICPLLVCKRGYSSIQHAIPPLRKLFICGKW
jgi:hypothetical protein